MTSSDFRSFDLHPSLLRAVADLGYTQPTPIQSDAIPPGLEGRDVLGCAMTGSGKTAAFLLPILNRLLAKPRGTTRALVLAPTRELAAQIVASCNDLARHTPLTAAAVHGGVAMGPQERAFRRGADVIVACPGRLLDHFRQSYARLAGLEVLVLDEADRMLDMGFLPDIRRVLRHLPKAEQTLFFSATMPPPIAELSRELLHDPVRIDVERRSQPATKVRQAVYPVRHDLKPRLLLELLRRDEIDNVLVFTRTKHRANRLADFLSKQGISADRIHGNRSQGQRTKALADFKSGATRVLVATDIAARGIDVEALSHVVNFDVPNAPEDYIHRVGRTARAGASGDALTLVSPQEHGELRAIERAVGERLPRLTVAGFDEGAPPAEALEIPIHQRLAAHRERSSRGRTANTQRRTQRPETPAAQRTETRQRAGGVAGGGEDRRPPGAGRGGKRRSPRRFR